MNFHLIFSVKGFQSRVGNNRTGRALAGLLVDYVGTIIIVGLSFLVTPILLAFLSVPMYGFWITTVQIILILNLVDGGAGVYLVKRIASAKTDEPDRLNQLINTTFWSYVFLGGLTLCVGMALSPFIAGWVKINAEDSTSATMAFQIAVFTAAISLIAIPTFYGVLQGYQQIALVNGIVYSVGVLSSLLALGLLYLHLGVEAMALGQLGSTLLGALAAFVFARRVCPSLNLLPRHFRWSELRQILAFTGYFQMSKLAYLTSTYSDNILIAGSYGAASVTTYSLTQKLATTCSMFVNKIGNVVMPGLAELFAGQETGQLQTVVLRLTSLLTRFGFLSLLMIASINQRFVTAWVGPDVFGGLILTALFAFSVFRNGLIRNLAVLFFSSGQLQGWGWLSLIEAGLKIGLTLALLPGLGLLAPMVGTVIAELLTGVYTPVRVAQLVQLPLSTLLLRGVGITLLKSLPTAGVLFVGSQWVPLQWSWLGIACIALSGLLANTLVFDWTQWYHGSYKRLVRMMGSVLRLPEDQ